MKKTVAILLAAILLLGLAGCAGSQQEQEVHKIGVIVYNLGDEEVVGFREYLQGYIEKNFEMVHFVYSGSISSAEQEMAFIQSAIDEGVEGFMSFLTYDLAAEVALCEKNGVYYMLASGTVDDDKFASVENNPWFLGAFGPGMEKERTLGADMAEHFIRDHPSKRYFILSGGASLGNDMHLQRTIGILETLLSQPGVTFTGSVSLFAQSTRVTSFSTDDFTITVCPGYIGTDTAAFNAARDTLSTGSYDAALSVLPPAEVVNYLGTAVLGVVDSFNERNFQLFANGKMDYLAGKYSSVIGPAFVLMLNAVTGHAEDFRDNGKAVNVTQCMWIAESAEEYNNKYALSSSKTMNAYDFSDLSRVCRLFNPDATLSELVALAQDCSYEAAMARRGG